MLGMRLQLILQWSAGILVLVRCFVDQRHFNVDIATKLGSSFSLVPFIIVVVRIRHFHILISLIWACFLLISLWTSWSLNLQVSCTLLAMIATLPLAQLFFFHVLLIQKVICTLVPFIVFFSSIQLEFFLLQTLFKSLFSPSVKCYFHCVKNVNGSPGNQHLWLHHGIEGTGTAGCWWPAESTDVHSKLLYCIE